MRTQAINAEKLAIVISNRVRCAVVLDFGHGARDEIRRICDFDKRHTIANLARATRGYVKIGKSNLFGPP